MRISESFRQYTERFQATLRSAGFGSKNSGSRSYDKISPAFEPYLADPRNKDKHEAVVLYRSPPIEKPPTRSSRVRSTRREFQAFMQAELHREIETRIVRSYTTRVGDDVEVHPIGASSIPAITIEVTPDTLEELAKQDDVLAILPNQSISLIKPTAINYRAMDRQEAMDRQTWGLENLEIQEVWHKTQGAGVNVGVLDTGVYGEHPLLEGRIAKFIMIDPLGRRINTSPMFDANGHGTHVCGTIVGGVTPDGIAVGMAPEAKIHMAAVLVGDATVRTLLEGLDWCVQQSTDIVNMSLGFNYYEPLFEQVFDVLINEYEILPVVAIGNENQGNSSSPGNVRNALSVGAVEQLAAGKCEVAHFSSGASLVFPESGRDNVVTKPDVVAPGVGVYSAIPPVLRTDGAYLFAYMDGTSMATPHVSGLAALLMSAYPNAPISEITQVIKETALHPSGDEVRPDNRWGYGLIQPEAAMLAMA